MSPLEIAVLSDIETKPIILNANQLAVLSLDGTLEEVANAAADSCRAQCLGQETCRLAIAITGEGIAPREISSACTDCPNPGLATQAVKTVLMFADHRLEAAKGVQMPSGSKEAAVENSEIFTRVENPQTGECFHVITVESIARLWGVISTNSPQANKAFASKIVGAITRSHHRLANEEAFQETYIAKDNLPVDLDSTYRDVLIVEKLDVILSDPRELHNRDIRTKGLALLKLLRRRAVDAGLLEATPSQA